MKRIVGLLSAVIFSIVVKGQQAGSISGMITNEKNEPVKSATVHVLNSDRWVIGDEQGDFHIGSLAYGKYTLEISAVGFATTSRVVEVDGSSNVFVVRLAAAGEQLDEVLVTAQKKEENLLQVPISISSISSEDVRAYRLWQSRDLSGVVSNLAAANPGDGRNVISVRGITSSSYDPAVVTYIDGVSQFSLDTYIPQLFDVERIDVLKGPQGTLYGRNALGGVINIITKNPVDKTSLSAEASAGSNGLQRYTFSFRTAILPGKLYFGAAGLYEGSNGFYTNDYYNNHFDKQHRLGGNFYLKYLIDPKWSITLNFKNLANRDNGAFPLNPSADDAFANPFHLNQDAVGQMVDNTLNGSLLLRYSGAHLNFSSQTAYQSNYRYYKDPVDGDFSPIDGVTIINNYGHDWNKVKVLTQEFRLSSPAASRSALKWTVGSYLFHQSIPNKQATHFGKDAMLIGSPDINYSVINTTKNENNGLAFYGQLEYAINTQWSVTGGLRYDYQHSKAEVAGAYQPDGSPISFPTQSDTSGGTNYSAVSPMLSLSYHPTANNQIYLSYNRGYRTGGLTQLSTDPSQPPLYPYKAEFSDNYELGVKNSFFNRRLTANIAFFYTLVNDVQVPTLILPDAITVTKNAGKLKSQGFEAELKGLILPGLEAEYNIGYTKATYTDLKLSSNGSEENLDGNHQIFTPDLTSMLAVQYGRPLNRTHTWYAFVRGEWYYFGKQYFDLANQIAQTSYQLVNASLGLSWKQFSLSGWMRNVGNSHYISYAYDFGAVHLGDPRNWGVTLRVELGK
ncbi:MAG TPA: TonB-dependent receptor [Puia sp.]|nr:TonB-dependent receptor [Puia sp.]